jgi:hypothetical protein
MQNTKVDVQAGQGEFSGPAQAMDDNPCTKSLYENWELRRPQAGRLLIAAIG